jgi:hypothetical protein
VDEKYVLNWLVVQIFQNIFTLKLWYTMIIIWKVEIIYPHTLGFYQLESIIILIDLLRSCTCDFIKQKPKVVLCKETWPFAIFSK